jgi:biotin carboxyl carrier protein
VKIQARVRDRHSLLSLSRDGGRYRGEVGGREVEAEVIEQGSGLLLVRMEGRSFEVAWWEDGNEFHLDLGGALVAVEILDPLRSAAGGGGEADGAGRREIRAAMPGKVVAVKVKQGEEVRQGQGLVVVEAMKMENEVPSPKAGRVVALEVVSGQTVEKGALLFCVE